MGEGRGGEGRVRVGQVREGKGREGEGWERSSSVIVTVVRATQLTK